MSYGRRAITMAGAQLLAAAVLSVSVVDGTQLAVVNFSLFAGVDITGANDNAFGGLCENSEFYNAHSTALWRRPTAVCDLVHCPRFGLRAGAHGPGGPYCIKGWVKNSSMNSYLSQRTCGVSGDGSVVAARTINGSCNDPSAQYTVCPDGGGDTMPLLSLVGASAASVATICEKHPECVGFLAPTTDLSGAVYTLLQYGFNGNHYRNYTTYTRIPVA